MTELYMCANERDGVISVANSSQWSNWNMATVVLPIK